MIQRIQSVYLLVVSILMVICMCNPVGSIIANTNEISEFGNLFITLPDGTTKTKWLPSLKEAGQMLLTFALAVVGWIIFRANSMGALTTWVAGICSSSLLTMPWLMTMAFNLPLLISILLLLVVEWSNRTKEHAFQIADYPKLLQVLLFYFLVAAIIVSMFKNELTATFIYFQF